MQLNHYRRHQAGVGMIEVLIAMLLLSIGVLGFTALQVRAVEASQEGYIRTQAINVARDLAERIHSNSTQLAAYKTALNSNAAPSAPTPSDCNGTTACTLAQLKDVDVYETRLLAQNFGARVSMPTIASASRASAIYVAWGDTTPTNGTAANTTDCTINGSYNTTARCVIMEAY